MNVWIGFSTDEMRRCKVQQSNEKWVDYYPLIKLGFNRQTSIDYVEKAGWPTPPRSSCYICPNQKNEEWLDMKANHTSDFKKACELEIYINKERKKNGRDALFFHKEAISLADINFATTQIDFWETGCESGMCFI